MGEGEQPIKGNEYNKLRITKTDLSETKEKTHGWKAKLSGLKNRLRKPAAPQIQWSAQWNDRLTDSTGKIGNFERKFTFREDGDYLALDTFQQKVTAGMMTDAIVTVDFDGPKLKDVSFEIQKRKYYKERSRPWFPRQDLAQMMGTENLVDTVMYGPAGKLRRSKDMLADEDPFNNISYDSSDAIKISLGDIPTIEFGEMLRHFSNPFVFSPERKLFTSKKTPDVTISPDKFNGLVKAVLEPI